MFILSWLTIWVITGIDIGFALVHKHYFHDFELNPFAKYVGFDNAIWFRLLSTIFAFLLIVIFAPRKYTWTIIILAINLILLGIYVFSYLS